MKGIMPGLTARGAWAAPNDRGPQQIREMKLFEGRFVLSADGRFHQFMEEDMKNACQQNNGITITAMMIPAISGCTHRKPLPRMRASD